MNRCTSEQITETRTYAMISTYPPTQCGIATFAAALSGGLYEYGDDVGIVRVGADGAPAAKIVVAELNNHDNLEMIDAGDALNRADVVIVQHEYGIYDGPDGESIVGVLEDIERPTIVVAHTVLEHPTPHQRSVLEAVVRAADAVVVMTEAGRVRLCSNFDVDARKISVIPHGAAVSECRSASRTPRKRPATSSRGGLLGPGKGIEWMIDALAMVDDLRPKPIYVVAGKTHPKVQGVRGGRLSVTCCRLQRGQGSTRRRGLQIPTRIDRPGGPPAVDQRVDDGDPALRLPGSGDLGRPGRRDRRRSSRHRHGVPARGRTAPLEAARASSCRDATPRRWPTPVRSDALTTPGMVKAMAE